MAKAGQADNGTTEAVAGTADTVDQQAGEAVDQAQQTVRDTGRETTETVQRTTETVVEQTREPGRDVTDTVTGVIDGPAYKDQPRTAAKRRGQRASDRTPKTRVQRVPARRHHAERQPRAGRGADPVMPYRSVRALEGRSVPTSAAAAADQAAGPGAPAATHESSTERRVPCAPATMAAPEGPAPGGTAPVDVHAIVTGMSTAPPLAATTLQRARCDHVRTQVCEPSARPG
ncbi:MAG: hypothetical protein ACRDU8_06705 [Egibacteraceae bacterium]